MTTILVVEDEGLIADDLQSTLIELGYEVPLTVGTGPEAIRAAEALRPALVLMDIKLKGEMDGVETAGVLHDRLGIPVVYLTSYSDSATLARAKRTGPYGYLLKPFDERDLRTTVEVALHKHSLERQLAERERWFSTTLRAIGDAVIATDPHEKVTFINPTAEALTGWKDGSAIGRRLGEVLQLERADGAARAGFAVARPNETGLITREGARVTIDDTASPIIDAHGRLLGGVVVFRDVTEQKKLEGRLAHSERLAALSTLAAGMAHEINNPLTSVTANVGLVAADLAALGAALASAPAVAHLARAVDGMREALRDASDGARRVAEIVHAMKKFARAEAVEHALVDLPQVLDEAIRRSRGAFQHGVTLSEEYGTTPFVSADEGQVVQVFSNLLVNAAQAIGEAGADAHRIRVVTLTDGGGRAVVEVHDNGCGIASVDLAKIFDPFFTRRGVGGGMGLGLSICHGVVGSLGGEIAVESAVGKGTTFRVALPPAPRPIVPPPSPEPVVTERRGRVLVIDDEPAVARSIERILSARHEVVVETDPRAALARIAGGQTFDVIVCDLMMPGFTGQDVYEALAAAQPALARRVVFVTGGSLSPARQRFLDGLGNVVLAKPFSVESVRAAVANMLRTAVP